MTSPVPTEPGAVTLMGHERRQILEDAFQPVEIDVIGSVAHFTATGIK